MTWLLLWTCLAVPVGPMTPCAIERSVHADLRACREAKAVELRRPDARRGECVEGEND